MQVEEKNKLSIDKCKCILNKNGNRFNDQEVKEIRDFLYRLAEIDFQNYKAHKLEKQCHD